MTAMAIIMLGSTLCLHLVLTFVSANPNCRPRDSLVYSSPIVTVSYSQLYSNMEEVLKTKDLDQLKNGFMSNQQVIIYLSFSVQVVNGTNASCPDDQWHSMAFCHSNSSDYDWDLCTPMHMTYGYQYDPVRGAAPWLSSLHGSVVLFAMLLTVEKDFPVVAYFKLTLEIDELYCHPSENLMRCAASELLSWIKVYSQYSEQSSIPLNFDHNQKGSVFFFDNVEFSAFKGVHQDIFIRIGLAEFMFVSLSVALIIAVYFPSIHDQIVSKLTRLEYQSLYWGTAVVCNVFTYGLVFFIGRGTHILLNYYLTLNNTVSIVAAVQEVVVHVILLVGSVIPLIRGGRSETPVPKGIISSLFHTSFCRFICCAAVSRKKTAKVMIVFSFMNFIYHNVMDLISLAFIMFVDKFRAEAITVSILYVLLVTFLALSISFVLFRLVQLMRQKQYLQLLTFFATLIVFALAAVFFLILFIAIFLSINTSGLNVLAGALLPSIILSAGSWYIKNRFQEELQTPPDHEGTKTGEPWNELAKVSNYDKNLGSVGEVKNTTVL